MKVAVEKSVFSDKALQIVEDYFFQDNTVKSLTATTQAIDLVGGGVKSNALPEEAWAVINHRISTERFVAGYVVVTQTVHSTDIWQVLLTR